MPYKDIESLRANKRAYAKTHREEIKRIHLAFRLRRRRQMHEHLGGKCGVCASTTNLEIHHVDPAKKSFGPNERMFSWVRTVEELKKCELLCEACHKTKHATRHGTTRMFKVYGCRCMVCVKGYRECMRQYYRRTKDKYRERQRRYNRRKKADELHIS